MRFEVVQVSAEQAREWLYVASGDVNQRSLSRRRVDRFTHAILGGQWRLTHQAIALAPSGAVLDGQHRLSAVIEAADAMASAGKDLRVPFLVAFDSDPESFGVIDTGYARTVGDTLRIAGYQNTNVLSAAIRTVLTYETLAGTTREWRGAANPLTTQDVLDWLDKPGNPDRARAAISLGGRVATGLGRPGLISVMTGAVLITHGAGRRSAITSVLAADFFERLVDGAALPTGSPILALRRFLIAEHGYGKLDRNTRRHTALGGTLSALNATALGDAYKPAHMFRAGVDPMPKLITRAEVSDALEAMERAAAEREAQLELPGA